MFKNNISVIGGAGHIGLPLSIKFSEKKFTVNIIDKNLNNLKLIQNGLSPFKELGINKRLNRQLKTGKLKFSSNLNSINNSKNIILCIGTPIKKNFKPDLEDFYKLIKNINFHIKENQNLIIRSSVSIGTNKKILKMIKKNCKNLAYCPERIVEGKSFQELPIIPQIISGSNKKVINSAVRLFKSITKKIIICEFVEAELSKVFSNLYRYINFAIPNEMYLISKNLVQNFLK